MRPRDVWNRGGSRVSHRQLEFPREDVEDDFDAFLAKRRQAPHIRSPHADGGGAKREGREDVRATAETAVDEDRRTPRGAFQDFRRLSIDDRPVSSARRGSNRRSRQRRC